DPKKVEAPLTPRQQAMKNLDAKRFADAVKSEMERISPSAPAKSHVESVRESAMKAMDNARELRAAGLTSSGLTIRE
ncbi:hypothetical protein, partial [Streptococcus pseudopneumoniae]|uniref:hypothetical protein n=1 Tax=Streptococcus pseudopneumoniae TaxID=257758 RepID=UPI0018B05995